MTIPTKGYMRSQILYVFYLDKLSTMKLIIGSILILISLPAASQKSLDTRIIVTVSDTAGLYEKVRMAFVNSDFIVKDTRRIDTLATYPRDSKPLGYVTALAAINGNTVTIWGFSANRQMNMLGYTVAPDEFTKVYYYKTGKGWKLLLTVAKALNGQLAYGK